MAAIPKLSALELLRKIPVPEAAALNGFSPDTFRRRYSHLIQKVSLRRNVVTLAHAIDLPPPDEVNFSRKPAAKRKRSAGQQRVSTV